MEQEQFFDNLDLNEFLNSVVKNRIKSLESSNADLLESRNNVIKELNEAKKSNAVLLNKIAELEKKHVFAVSMQNRLQEQWTASEHGDKVQFIVNIMCKLYNINPKHSSVYRSEMRSLPLAIISIIYMFYDNKDIVIDLINTLLKPEDRTRAVEDALNFKLARDFGREDILNMLKTLPTRTNGEYNSYGYSTFPYQQPYTEYLSSPLVFTDAEIRDRLKSVLKDAIFSCTNNASRVLECINLSVNRTAFTEDSFNEVMFEILTQIKNEGTKIKFPRILLNLCVCDIEKSSRIVLNRVNQELVCDILKYNILTDTKYEYPFCKEILIKQLDECDSMTDKYNFLSKFTRLSMHEKLTITFKGKSHEEISAWLETSIEAQSEKGRYTR
ncbi:MAG: hypothetical protein ACRDD8_03915 [Bacteroidales bacterium]